MARQRTRAEGESLVAKFHESGLTAVEFAKQEGVTLCSLRWWLKRPKAKRKGGNRRSQHPGFAEVKPKKADIACEDVMRVEVGPARIVFSIMPDAAWLAAFAVGLGGRA